MKRSAFLLLLLLFFTYAFAQHWENLGPYNGNGPAIKSLIQHPTSSEIFYAGSNGEGVFKSYDKGDSWEMISQDLIPGDISALAVSTTDADFLFVGSSDGRLFKSPDGGDTWINISGNLPEGQIVDIKILEGTEKVYVALTGASPDRGLFWSNDGANWFLVSQEFNDVEVFSFGINPDNPEVMYASIKTGYLSGKLYRSIDGGNSWEIVLNNFIVDVEIDPNNSEKLIAVGHSEIVYISENSGDSWYDYTGFLNIQYFDCVAFNRSNSDELLLSGENSSYGPSVYRSTNGGYAWSGVEIGDPFSFYYEVVYDWDDGNNALIGSPTGLFKSTDGGENWMISNTGLTRISAYGIFIKNNNPAHWIINTDVGIQITDNYGEEWDKILCWWDVADYVPGTDTIYGVLGVSSYSDGLYKSEDNGYSWEVVEYMMNLKDVKIADTDPYRLYIIFHSNVYRSDDGGINWTGASAGINESPIKDLIIDQSHPDTMYIMTPTHVWKTVTGGFDWAALPGPFDTCQPQALAVDPHNAGRIYVGANEALLISDDGGINWETFDMPALGLRSICLSPEFPGFIAVGYDDEGVFISLDDGLSWSESNEGLQSLNIRSLEVSPGSEFMLCGTHKDGVNRMDLEFVGIHSVQVNADHNEITIFPQPASCKITIQCHSAIQQSEIYGIGGHLYIRSKDKTINISGLSKGLYLLKTKIMGSEKVFINKIVKY